MFLINPMKLSLYKMKLFLLFLLFFAIQCPLIFAENIFNIGHFRSSDKTGKICTPTIDGWKITIPPGKEGHHYFYWQNRKPLCFPAVENA